MRIIVLVVGLTALALGSQANAWVHVRSYARHNGTFVGSHFRTNPDHSRFNNWSTRGNVNPLTGKAGTKSPFPSPSPRSHPW